jgi:ribosomal protein L13E
LSGQFALAVLLAATLDLDLAETLGTLNRRRTRDQHPQNLKKNAFVPTPELFHAKQSA